MKSVGVGVNEVKLFICTCHNISEFCNHINILESYIVRLNHTGEINPTSFLYGDKEKTSLAKSCRLSMILLRQNLKSSSKSHIRFRVL